MAFGRSSEAASPSRNVRAGASISGSIGEPWLMNRLGSIAVILVVCRYQRVFCPVIAGLDPGIRAAGERRLRPACPGQARVQKTTYCT